MYHCISLCTLCLQVDGLHPETEDTIGGLVDYTRGEMKHVKAVNEYLRSSLLPWITDSPFAEQVRPSHYNKRHSGRDSVSNYQPHHCLLNRLFRRRSKETSKLRVSGLCAGNSPVTGEFPAQMASNAENVSIWWRHHEKISDRGHYSKWPTRFRRPFWIMAFDQRPTLQSTLFLMMVYDHSHKVVRHVHTQWWPSSGVRVT